MKYRILEENSYFYDDKDGEIYFESKFYPQIKKSFFSCWKNYMLNENKDIVGYTHISIVVFDDQEKAEKFLNDRIKIDKGPEIKIHEFPKRELSLDEQAFGAFGPRK